MPKKAVSITLEAGNLLWLRGRATVLAGGSLSAAVDQLIAEARAGRLGASEVPLSVVGTIDVPDEEALASATAQLRALFAGSLNRGMATVRPAHAARPVRKK
jgi:hypothetical protein